MSSASARRVGTRRRPRPSLILYAVAVLLVTGLVLLTSHVARDQSGPNLVSNGGFENGLTGWRTTKPSHRLLLDDDGRFRGHAAALSAPGGRASITPVSDVVGSTRDDNVFRAEVWVKSSSPGVQVSLMVRRTRDLHSFISTNTLQAGKWTKIKLTTPPLPRGIGLRLGIFAKGLRGGATLHVDDVTCVQVEGQAARRPPVDRSTPYTRQRQATLSARTLFGTSLSTNGQTIGEAVAGEEAKFGTLPVVRVFDPGLPPPDAWSRRQAAVAGKTVVTSFRLPPRAVVSGAYDAALRHFFANAPRDQVIFWSLNHEPEPEIIAGDYTAAEFRKAWRHVDALALAADHPNLYSTLVLTGYTADPASGRDWRTYFPGRSFVDVIAWDTYNSAVGPTTGYEPPELLLGSVVSTSKKANLPFAIAELGSPRTPDDLSGERRARWLRECADYLRRHGAVFVTYFDSTRDGQFILDDQAAIDVWRNLVQVP